MNPRGFIVAWLALLVIWQSECLALTRDWVIINRCGLWWWASGTALTLGWPTGRALVALPKVETINTDRITRERAPDPTSHEIPASERNQWVARGWTPIGMVDGFRVENIKHVAPGATDTLGRVFVSSYPARLYFRRPYAKAPICGTSNSMHVHTTTDWIEFTSGNVNFWVAYNCVPRAEPVVTRAPEPPPTPTAPSVGGSNSGPVTCSGPGCTSIGTQNNFGADRQTVDDLRRELQKLREDLKASIPPRNEPQPRVIIERQVIIPQQRSPCIMTGSSHAYVVEATAVMLWGGC